MTVGYLTSSELARLGKERYKQCESVSSYAKAMQEAHAASWRSQHVPQGQPMDGCDEAALVGKLDTRRD